MLKVRVVTGPHTDPFAPTEGVDAVQPPAPQPPVAPHPAAVVGWSAPVPRRPRGPWLFGAAGLGVGFGLGVLIGLLAGAGDPAGPAAAAATGGDPGGELAVSSEPTGGVVLVDGRVVGLTPIPRLELAAGDHSIAIDLFGYQPYLGTLTIESGGKAGLDAHLAALGDTSGGKTRGDFRGAGKAVARPVPRSALIGSAAGSAAGSESATAAGSAAAAAKSKKRRRARRPPSGPKRNCSAEERQCKYDCDRAKTRCDFGCPGCSSCLTSDGWDKCRQMCNSCRQGCKSNLTFCESRCESARRQCR